jgi:hypothetical protein
MRPIERDRRRARRPRWMIAAWFAGACATAAPLPADARSEKTLAYPRDQAWPAAIRFLAVDERLKITDKDADAGYVVFELREERRVFRGSLEVVTLQRDGRAVVRFVLQIADRPSWVELAMLGRLEDKLRAELGSPAPPVGEPPRKEPGKDAGKEPGKDAGNDGKGGAGDAPDRAKPDDGPRISPTP